MIVSFFLEFLKNILWWTIFWIFGGSNDLDSLLFLFSCHCQPAVSLSAVIVNKKIFAFIFQTQHS